MDRNTVVVGNLAPGYKINTALVGRIAKKVLRNVARGRHVSLEVLFMGDRNIRKLNKRFKGRDGNTDVLSFGLGRVGSIAVSLDTASRNAKIFGTLLHEEALRYVIHGILHLFGYDDDTKLNRLKMSSKEDRMLESVCSNINLSKALTRR